MSVLGEKQRLAQLLFEEPTSSSQRRGMEVIDGGCVAEPHMGLFGSQQEGRPGRYGDRAGGYYGTTVDRCRELKCGVGARDRMFIVVEYSRVQ